MSGAPHSFRFATFVELNLSGLWSGSEIAYDGFQTWSLDGAGSVSITRSDGKVLSFDLTNGFYVDQLNNVARWDPEGVAGAEGPFQ
jgi:hypothetical protein